MSIKETDKKNKTKWIVLSSLIAAILVGLLVFLIVSIVSGEGFRPIPRTEEEATVVFRMDDEEVHYDLYRCLFRNYANSYENLPETEAEKAERFTEIHERVMEDIASIYAMLRTAEYYGAGKNSALYKDAYKTLLRLTREGGKFEGNRFEGYKDVNTYLAALESRYMNDAVYRLYLEMTAAEYAGTKAFMQNPAKYADVSDEALRSFLLGEDAVAVTYAFVSYSVFGNNVDAARDSAEELYDALFSRRDDLESYIRYELQASLSASQAEQYDIQNGIFLTRHHSETYSALAEAAFLLDVGEMSGMIETPEGIYILRRLPVDEAKVDRMMAEVKDSLRATYFASVFYQKAADFADELLASTETTAFFYGFTYDTVMQ